MQCDYNQTLFHWVSMAPSSTAYSGSLKHNNKICLFTKLILCQSDLFPRPPLDNCAAHSKSGPVARSVIRNATSLQTGGRLGGTKMVTPTQVPKFRPN